MSKTFPLKSIFGDWEVSSFQQSAALLGDTVMDEVLVFNLPEQFNRDFLEPAIMHTLHKIMPDCPPIAWMAEPEENKKFVLHMVFQYAVDREPMLYEITEALDMVLTASGVDCSEQMYCMDVSTQGNYEEAAAYIREHYKPRPPH